MLAAGDEMGRSQGGNNNAYCQDNPVSWIDWRLDADGERLLAFTRRLGALRRRHALFRRRTFFDGRSVGAGGAKDIAWLTPAGRELTPEEWSHGFARCIGVYLSGQGLAERDERGRPIDDDDLVVLLNAHDEAIAFAMPAHAPDGWQPVLDTAHPDGDAPHAGPLAPHAAYGLQARSLALLRRPRAA